MTASTRDLSCASVGIELDSVVASQPLRTSRQLSQKTGICREYLTVMLWLLPPEFDMSLHRLWL